MATAADYIRSHFTLTLLPDGQWEAVAVGCEWSDVHRVVGEREQVCSTFRRHWGHFNFAEECRAFREIFG